LTQLGRSFALSETPGRGVYCGEQGAFIGDVALLIKQRDLAGYQKWTVRSLSEINRDLSKRYGIPVEFKVKASGFATVARALDRGDIVLAQLAMLHLQLPDPPLANTVAFSKETARKLLSSGLLKADWNPDEHPRWPRGTPDGIGGEFAPKDTAGDDLVDATSDLKPRSKFPECCLHPKFYRCRSPRQTSVRSTFRRIHIRRDLNVSKNGRTLRSTAWN
jgi:hypothetical protein